MVDRLLGATMITQEKVEAIILGKYPMDSLALDELKAFLDISPMSHSTILWSTYQIRENRTIEQHAHWILKDFFRISTEIQREIIESDIYFHFLEAVTRHFRNWRNHSHLRGWSILTIKNALRSRYHKEVKGTNLRKEWRAEQELLAELKFLDAISRREQVTNSDGYVVNTISNVESILCGFEEQERSILMLREVEKHPWRKCSELTGVSVSTLRRRHASIVAKFEKEAIRRGVRRCGKEGPGSSDPGTDESS